MRFSVAFSIFAIFFASACGGGSGSDGVVFQGTLTERGGGHSSDKIALKHSAGQRIGDVKVCILGECSITDEQGQWGVNVGEFAGGGVTIVLEGHGINTSAVTEIHSGARDIYMDLNHARGVVSITNLTIDGEDHTGHQHEDEHS